MVFNKRPVVEPRALALLLVPLLTECRSSEECMLGQRVRSLERENGVLRAQIDSMRSPEQRMAHAITAQVLGKDDELKLVILDKGTGDGVVAGLCLDVYRGAEYKSLVRILDVFEKTCSGLIVHEHAPIAVGDTAAANP